MKLSRLADRKSLNPNNIVKNASNHFVFINMLNVICNSICPFSENVLIVHNSCSLDNLFFAK